MQKKKSATSVHPLVGSERQFSICTFVKVTHVPLLANWSGIVANNEAMIRALDRFGGYGYECGAELGTYSKNQIVDQR